MLVSDCQNKVVKLALNNILYVCVHEELYANGFNAGANILLARIQAIG